MSIVGATRGDSLWSYLLWGVKLLIKRKEVEQLMVFFINRFSTNASAMPESHTMLVTYSSAVYRLWIRSSQNHTVSLHWRHNDHDGVSNHPPHGCLLDRLFRRRSKKTSKLRATGLCVGNSPEPVNYPHKGPVTRKVFPFDDVIMLEVVVAQFTNIITTTRQS